MAEASMVMPKMGESVMEATVLQWLKKEGDTVTEDESILEVATDKVDSEIPATYAGTLKKILAQVGEIVGVGKPIAIIDTDGEIVVPTNKKQVAIAMAEPAAQKAPEASQTMGKVKQISPVPTFTQDHLAARGQTGRFYSPLVRYIAQKEGISSQELDQIPGTGKDNRVTKQDILAYLSHRKHPKTTYPPAAPFVNLTTMPGDEVIPMDRMRKMIAERMVASMHTAPHVTSFVEADVTTLVHWRNQHKVGFEQKTGVPLTYMPLFIKAIVRAIQDFPMINVSVVGDHVIKRKAINIGLAVALPEGNLIVPVIKSADQLSLTALATRVRDLAHQARTYQLIPDDVAEGTYTVSNIGSFQNLMGTPIIMQPQVAILALGAITKKPAVVETPQGDAIAIRHKIFLSHTYDHRVVDGALGGMFVKRVADNLENFDMARAFD